MTSLVQSFQWRYATKKYNPTKKLSEEQFSDLAETVRLAPSSFGLQPYQFIVVKDQEKLQAISKAAHGQPQISTGSHVIVVAVETDLDERSVASYIDKAAVTRKVDRKELAPREAFVNTMLNKLDHQQRIHWAEKQAFLAVGVLVSAAAAAGVDASPMEGFDAAAVDDLLQLKQRHLTAALIFVLGYRSDEDEFASIPKVRKPLADIFSFV